MLLGLHICGVHALNMYFSADIIFYRFITFRGFIMFKSKIVRYNKLTSKKGSPFGIAWVNTPSGLPCKVFVWDNIDSFSAGMDVIVDIEPDNSCNATVVIKKA